MIFSMSHKYLLPQGVTLLLLLLCFNKTYSQSDSIYAPFNVERLSAEDIKPGQQAKSREIISASRSSKNIEELPVGVYVITKEEILNNGYNTLVDVLKTVPGVRVSQPGSAIEGETFLMRGLFGNYYTKILINNLPVQPSATSGMPVGAQLPIKQAERIEIIFGPASAIYGADAMGGVINIITKDADQTIFAQADISSGQFGYNQINTMFGGKLGKDNDIIRYSLYASNTERNDLNVKYNKDSVYTPMMYTNDSSFINNKDYSGTTFLPNFQDLPQKSQLMGAQLKYRSFKAEYQYMYRRDHSAIGLFPLASSYSDATRFYAERINRLSVGYDENFNRIAFSGNASYLKYNVDKNSSSLSIEDWVKNGVHYKYAASDDIYAEQLVTFRLNKNFEFLSGASLQNSGNLPINNYLLKPFDTELYKPFSKDKIAFESEITDSLPTTVFQNRGAFVQVYFSSKKLNTIAGVRYDKHSIYGSSINPRIALSYRIGSKNIFRASFSKAFRAPSSYYVYSSLTLPNLKPREFIQLQNEELQPERLYAYEVGNKTIFSERVTFDISAFYQYISNLITNSLILDTALNAKNILTFAYLNDLNSSGTLMGIQTVLGCSDIIPSIKLNADLHASVSKGKEVLPLNRGELSGFRMVPSFMGQLHVSFSPLPKFLINVNTLYMSKWIGRMVFTDPFTGNNLYFENKGYYTFDLVTRYKFNQNFQAFVKVLNVLNAQYAGLDAYGSLDDLMFNPQMGRNLQVGISFRLN